MRTAASGLRRRRSELYSDGEVLLEVRRGSQIAIINQVRDPVPAEKMVRFIITKRGLLVVQFLPLSSFADAIWNRIFDGRKFRTQGNQGTNDSLVIG